MLYDEGAMRILEARLLQDLREKGAKDISLREMHAIEARRIAKYQNECGDQVRCNSSYSAWNL